MNYTTKYRDVKAFVKSSPIRDTLRSLALSSLSQKNRITNGFTKSFQKNRIQFIYLHHLFDDEIVNFKKLVAFLAEEHTFISYSEAVQLINAGDINKPYIVFSSDDGFKNNLQVAEILKDYGASCCFFVITNMIGENNFDKVSTFNRDVLNFPPVEYLNWNDLELLIKQGHEIGGHTTNHANLGSLHESHFEEEIGNSYGLLNSRLGEHLSLCMAIWYF